MQFLLTEEQEMLRTMAREFLENESPKTYVRQMMEHEQAIHRSFGRRWQM